ncbi:HutD family protein [Streptomyces sp. SID3343]|uniref:HutD family protein n=1 Tax=Streptomyces sp. SID3343 TaxID=2690260 RepID=UPI00136B0F59|nr:HutD family protein [Streptomyces sp. SID3343]
MRFFDVETLPVSAWRNGGGETREIAGYPVDAADFGWRASIATIAQDGPFSAFPGVDRSITLIAGDGVRLVGDGGLDHRLDRTGEPFAFSGDVALRATLLGGDSRDFNVMTRRGQWTADVRRITGRTILPAGHAGVVYVVQGRWRCERELAAGQGAWWTNSTEREAVPLAAGAVALWADIRPVGR